MAFTPSFASPFTPSFLFCLPCLPRHHFSLTTRKFSLSPIAQFTSSPQYPLVPLPLPGGGAQASKDDFPFSRGDSVGSAGEPCARVSSLACIRKAGVIACVRAESAELALELSRTALDGGISVLEVTMTTPGATEVVCKLVEEYPSAAIGAGTVLSKCEADSAVAAGVKFLMSPVAIQKLVEAHREGPVLFIPGAMTPTEVVNAHQWGAVAVKMYPIALVGGIQFVQALRKPLPQIPLIASHGITLEMVEPYITAGAIAVVLSDAIFDRTLIAARDFQKIKQKAMLAVEKGAKAAMNAGL